MLSHSIGILLSRSRDCGVHFVVSLASLKVASDRKIARRFNAGVAVSATACANKLQLLVRYYHLILIHILHSSR